MTGPEPDYIVTDTTDLSELPAAVKSAAKTIRQAQKLREPWVQLPTTTMTLLLGAAAAFMDIGNPSSPLTSLLRCPHGFPYGSCETYGCCVHGSTDDDCPDCRH